MGWNASFAGKYFVVLNIVLRIQCRGKINEIVDINREVKSNHIQNSHSRAINLIFEYLIYKKRKTRE